MKPVRRKPMAGFTLMEVLVALVIMGIGIGSILVAYSGSLRFMQRARDEASAAVLARSKLEEVIAIAGGEIAGDEGDERYNGTLYSYRISFIPVELVPEGMREKLGELPQLEEIRVEVFWGEKTRDEDQPPHHYLLSTYRHQKAPTPPASGKPPGKT